MLIFLFQIVFIILGIKGFFAPITYFMIISLAGLILCDIIGIISGELKSLNTYVIYFIIAIVLCFFVDRAFWEILSITFSICSAIECILGSLLMIRIFFSMNKPK